MTDSQERNGDNKKTESEKSVKDQLSRKKSAKVRVSSKQTSDGGSGSSKSKKKEHDSHFSIKASLFDAAQMACNIVEITQDSTLRPQKTGIRDIEEKVSIFNYKCAHESSFSRTFINMTENCNKFFDGPIRSIE
ncbi:unnamed protein product [Gongylonema pulchrum]|uniref:Uncharacterized protein n=1 Tax=Gongylonema pulchrum TaxID=637853 RepID=A0A183D2K7_9BILA|nr:unnamed protein product [Gongylonema pulchrum]